MAQIATASTSAVPDTTGEVYHGIELGDVKALQAIKVTTPCTDATKAAVHELNCFIRDMAMGNVLIPGLPQAQAQNPRTDRFNQLKEQGNKLFKEQKNEEAVKYYTLASQMAATRPVYENSNYAREELNVALNNRSAAYLQSGDPEKAVVDADAAIKLKPMMVKSHFRRGKALIAAGRLQEARESFLLGLEFEPTAEDLLTSLTDLDKAILEKAAAAPPAS